MAAAECLELIVAWFVLFSVFIKQAKDQSNCLLVWCATIEARKFHFQCFKFRGYCHFPSH